MSVNKLEYHAIGARGARGGVGDSCGGATVSTPELDGVRGSRSLTALCRSLSAPKMVAVRALGVRGRPRRAHRLDWPTSPLGRPSFKVIGVEGSRHGEAHRATSVLRARAATKVGGAEPSLA